MAEPTSGETAENIRDPRIDPRAGDVITTREGLRVEVTATSGVGHLTHSLWVYSHYSMTSYGITILCWHTLARGAKVVHAEKEHRRG